ncbi:MAG: energy transducer TonB [Chthoniobacterales bacterium]|nr:energy transducer TonB [Chthoniobacterales bacterium]
MVQVERNLFAASRERWTLPTVALLLAALVAGCSHMNYQDRARTPLKPMKSVVHVKSSAFDTPPRVLEGERPEYPALEADRREKGFVSVICTINVEGKAEDFAIETMTNPAFAYAAMVAIAKWRWAPAMKNGHPVAQKVRVPMHFNAI